MTLVAPPEPVRLAFVTAAVWDVMERHRFPRHPHLRTPAEHAAINSPAWIRAQEVAVAALAEADATR